MTPIALRRSSDRATAVLQAMRDAADVVDGRSVGEYEGPEPEVYQRILEEWVADLRAPDVRPMIAVMPLRMVPAP